MIIMHNYPLKKPSIILYNMILWASGQYPQVCRCGHPEAPEGIRQDPSWMIWLDGFPHRFLWNFLLKKRDLLWLDDAGCQENKDPILYPSYKCFFFVFVENSPKLGTCIFWLRREICGETSSKGWWRWTSDFVSKNALEQRLLTPNIIRYFFI